MVIDGASNRQKRCNERNCSDDELEAKMIENDDCIEKKLSGSNNFSKTANVKSEPGSDNADLTAQSDNQSGLAGVVAAHYNQVKEVGIELRKESRIFFMRNLNNWIKSMFIEMHLRHVKDDQQKRSGSFRKLRVLDLCCGKGGDIRKWQHGPITHVIFADIAGTSVDQCRSRYDALRDKSFSAEFITADCTRVRLREKMADVTMQLDVVSCQFAFHYCFESLPQAEMMLKNASECLRTGGRFIGTIPNSTEIVHRIRTQGASTDGRFGNEIFSVTPHCQEPYSVFGAKYDFKLEEVVNCPEFLVHFPTLVKLAGKFGLKLVEVCTLPKFVQSSLSNGRDLLSVMQALETYPAPEGKSLVTDPKHYEHAHELTKEGRTVGTLSAPEWDVVSLYLLFVFEKVERTSWNDEGKPVYNI